MGTGEMTVWHVLLEDGCGPTFVHLGSCPAISAQVEQSLADFMPVFERVGKPNVGANLRETIILSSALISPLLRRSRSMLS